MKFLIIMAMVFSVNNLVFSAEGNPKPKSDQPVASTKLGASEDCSTETDPDKLARCCRIKAGELTVSSGSKTGTGTAAAAAAADATGK